MYIASEKISFIEKCFGKGACSRDGLNLSVRCPICADVRAHKMKLVIRTDIDITHCWVCGFKSRSLIPLLRKYSTPERLNEYQAKFFQGKEFGSASDKITTDTGPKPVALPTDYKLLACCKRDNDPDVWSALNYLEGRGITEDDLWYFKFGIARGDIRYINRIFLPSFDADGVLNYFTARSWGKHFQAYMNCDADRLGIVFNEINIDWTQPLNLVEGPFDLVKCPSNTTPLLGSNLNEESMLFNKIIMYNTPVVLMLDSEMKAKAMKYAKRLMSYDVSVKIADIGNHKDPGEMSKQEVINCLAKAKIPTWESQFTLKLESLTSSKPGSWLRQTT